MKDQIYHYAHLIYEKVVMRVGRENVVFFINGAGLIDFSYGKMNLFPGGFYM